MKIGDNVIAKDIVFEDDYLFGLGITVIEISKNEILTISEIFGFEDSFVSFVNKNYVYSISDFSDLKIIRKKKLNEINETR